MQPWQRNELGVGGGGKALMDARTVGQKGPERNVRQGPDHKGHCFESFS